jgi:hypothetical protein
MPFYALWDGRLAMPPASRPQVDMHTMHAIGGHGAGHVRTCPSVSARMS